jgi:RND family efflux transporter MFP subunit
MAGCEQEPEKSEFVRPVRVMKVQDVEGFIARSFPGKSAATQEINLAFQVPGKLIKRPVDVGKEVKKGNLIASLDPSIFQTEVDRLKAELVAAQARRKNANLQLGRKKTLHKKGWVAQAQVDVLQSKARQARAEVVAIAAALKRAKLDLSHTTIVAPFSGIVVETYVENFQEIIAKQPVVRLVDTAQIEFWVSIPESLISLAPYVRDITVEFDAFKGKRLRAKIKEIKKEASEITRSYAVNLIMEQPESFVVLPGMVGTATHARLEIPEDQKVKGYEIPLSAIYSGKKDEQFVWVVDPSTSVISRRAITTIEITTGGVKADGVTPGDVIVTAGVEYLHEGQKVRLMN